MDILEIRRRARQRAEDRAHQDSGASTGAKAPGAEAEHSLPPDCDSAVPAAPSDPVALSSAFAPAVSPQPPPPKSSQAAPPARAQETELTDLAEVEPVDDDGVAELLDEFFASRNDAAINRFADPAFFTAAQALGRNDPDNRRFLACRVGAEEYGLDLDYTREILKPIPPTPVPRAPRQVLGIISVRGMIMPVVDLGEALGLQNIDRQQAQSRPRYIVVEYQGDRVCLRVDAVSSVVALSMRNIEPAPRHSQDINSEFVSGLGRVDERMLILLDLDHVLEKLIRVGGA